MTVNKSKFENLEAWKAAHELTIAIYKMTKKFPTEEKFRLIDQLCRSSSSVAANLAEGSARAYRKEYTQFAYQAKGSLEETKYHLLLSKDLGYLKDSDYQALLEQANLTGKLVSGLIRYLRSNPQDLRTKIKEPKL
jgi:four helix bundle protein